MHLIFDFDGTLVDSFDCVMKKSKLLAEEFHFRQFHLDEINQLRDLTSKEIIQSLNIPWHKIPRLIRSLRTYLHDEMHTLLPVKGIPCVLEQLHEAGFSLGILTSNSAENVKLWLEQHQLGQFFNYTHIESTYFSKAHVLKKTLRLYPFEKSAVYYIGDETRDIEAAQQNQVNAVAVTWGYNSLKALLPCKPGYIVHQPEDILRICGLADDVNK